jgi:hypothetical protein
MAGIVKLVVWIVRGIRFIGPIIVRIIGATFWAMTTAACAWWVGVPATAQRIADFWRREAYMAGVPTEYESTVYHLGYAVAMFVIFACWMLAAYLTVIVIGVIF